MPSNEELIDPSRKDEFVPAIFAHSVKEAEQYHQLLEDHDIEAIMGYEEMEEDENAEGDMTHGLPVLVLESFLDEAGEIIADRDREDQDEFEDDEFEDEEEDDELESLSPAREDDIDDEEEAEDEEDAEEDNY